MAPHATKAFAFTSTLAIGQKAISEITKSSKGKSKSAKGNKTRNRGSKAKGKGSRNRGAKSPPNPHGQHGKPDHRDKVTDIAGKLKGQLKSKELVVLGEKVRGHPTNRRPDVQIVDRNNKTRKIVEIERNPNKARNKAREKEYDELGIVNETFGVGVGEGKGKSDTSDVGSNSNGSEGSNSDGSDGSAN